VNGRITIGRRDTVRMTYGQLRTALNELEDRFSTVSLGESHEVTTDIVDSVLEATVLVGGVRTTGELIDITLQVAEREKE